MSTGTALYLPYSQRTKFRFSCSVRKTALGGEGGHCKKNGPSETAFIKELNVSEVASLMHCLYLERGIRSPSHGSVDRTTELTHLVRQSYVLG